MSGRSATILRDAFLLSVDDPLASSFYIPQRAPLLFLAPNDHRDEHRSLSQQLVSAENKVELYTVAA